MTEGLASSSSVDRSSSATKVGDRRDAEIGSGDAQEIAGAADTVGGAQVAAEATALAEDGDTFSTTDGGAGAIEVVETPVDGTPVEAPVDGAAVAPPEEGPMGNLPGLDTLTDPTLTAAEVQAKLSELETHEITSLVTALDEGVTNFGQDATPAGVEGLYAEIDHRFDEALQARDFARNDLADLALAVNQQRANTQAPRSSDQWLDRAFTAASMTDHRSDPAAAERYTTLDRARLARGLYVNGPPPVTEMSNRELLGHVQRIPGMRTAGAVLGLTGFTGMGLQLLGEGRASELMREMTMRGAEGRLPPDLVQGMLAHASQDPDASGAIGAIETASMLSIAGLGRNLLERGARNAPDILQTGARQLDAADYERLREAAEAAYDQIRARTDDVDIIAKNLGLRPENVQRIKNHLFMDDRILYDEYPGGGVLKRFDADPEIAAMWNRAIEGRATAADWQLLRHEAAEAWVMRTTGDLRWSNAHRIANGRYPSPLE